MDKKYIQAIRPVTADLRELLKRLDDGLQLTVREIRLRRDKPVTLISDGRPIFMTESGRITFIGSVNARRCTAQELDETFRACCGYSVHSHTGEIANGFVTLEGGHRVGVCGTAVYDGDRIVNQRGISSLCIRVAREFRNAADGVDPVMRSGLRSVLIAGAPSSGKTTVLRDLARRLSDGHYGRSFKVAVIDERGELASVCRGAPQNDVGANTDVLDGFSKGDGILQAVRTLSPDVVICDEIGGGDECRAIRYGLNSGVRFIASVHAGDAAELKRKTHIAELIGSGAFEYTVFLKSGGRPSQVERIVKNEVDGFDFTDLDGLRDGTRAVGETEKERVGACRN